MKKISTRIIKLNAINLLIFSICFMILVISNLCINKVNNNINVLKNNIEQHWREQARHTIDHSLLQLKTDHHNNLVNIYDNTSLNNWAVNRVDGIRNGSESSRGWLGKLEFKGDKLDNIDVIYNIENIKCFTYDLRSHENIIINDEVMQLRLGKPNENGDHQKWDINGDIIWIEYDFLIDTLEENKDTNICEKVIMTIEIHSKEIFSRYNTYFNKQQGLIYCVYTILISSIILCITVLSIIVIKYME